MKRLFAPTLLIFLACQVSGVLAAAPEPSAAVVDMIKANTFMIIPVKQVVMPLSVGKAREVYDTVCAAEGLPLSERLNCKVLASCRGEDCLREYGDHGTAFSVNDGDEIYTAWHVLFQSHETALTFLHKGIESRSPERQAELFRSLVPSFVIANQNEEIIYDSRDDSADRRTQYVDFGNPLNPICSGTGLKKDQAYGYYENISEDYVKVKLREPISRGLIITHQPQEFYYSAGFSFDALNTAFDVFSGVGAEMVDLKKATGRFSDLVLDPLPLTKAEILKLSTREILILMGYSAESADKQIRDYEDIVLRANIEKVIGMNLRHQRDKLMARQAKVIFFTNPVMSGQSGGPLFNAYGEVTGIVTNSFPGARNAQGGYQSHGGAARLF